MSLMTQKRTKDRVIKRIVTRGKLGPLKDLVASDRTKRRYEDALIEFFEYLDRYELTAFLGKDLLEDLVCEFIEYAWSSGSPRYVVGDLLSGFTKFIPQLQGKLVAGWQLFTTWQKHELPDRATPMLTVPITVAAHTAVNIAPLSTATAGNAFA